MKIQYKWHHLHSGLTKFLKNISGVVRYDSYRPSSTIGYRPIIEARIELFDGNWTIRKLEVINKKFFVQLPAGRFNVVLAHE